jgi:hypothetical protein
LQSSFFTTLVAAANLEKHIAYPDCNIPPFLFVKAPCLWAKVCVLALVVKELLAKV